MHTALHLGWKISCMLNRNLTMIAAIDRNIIMANKYLLKWFSHSFKYPKFKFKNSLQKTCNS